MMAHGWRQARDAAPWVLGFAALFALGRGEVAKFENRAASEIRSTLGGGQVSVKTRSNGAFGYVDGNLARVTIRASAFSTPTLPFFTEPERSRSGKARRVELRLSDFELAGLHVDRLEADIPDCRYDLPLARKRGQIRLSQSGEGTGLVVLSQEGLERFVRAKFPAIKDLTLRLEGGFALVEGSVESPLLKAKFMAAGRLATADGRRLNLVDALISFDGKPAEPAAGQALMRSLNPVVDLDRDLGLHGALDVELIVLERGLLEARGKARIPVRSSLGVRELARAFLW